MKCPVSGCDFESTEKGVHSHCGQSHSDKENPYRKEKECDNCKNTFIVCESDYEAKDGGNYCSRKCRSNDKTVSCECEYCGEIFNVIESVYERGGGKYCSKNCRGLDDRKRIKRECKHCGERFGVVKSQLEYGAGVYCSNGCKNEDMKSSDPRIRDSHEYRQFRQSVLDRDDYNCTKCGKDNELHVHHIVAVSENESLATDVDNGITLCGDCHAETHKKQGDERIVNFIKSN